jgi:hypothetical protein
MISRMKQRRRVERNSVASLTLLACFMLVLLLTTITPAAGSQEHAAIGAVEARSTSLFFTKTNGGRYLESNSSNPHESNNGTETTDDVESHGEDDVAHDGEEEEGHEEPANALLFPSFTMVVGVAVFYLLTR